ncbi:MULTISPECIES: hypothetical protein [unclassified Streptomyces]|uniref:hypothetical protein n=1 Tax=unclassified Streptomyces TaxID=2593676 RepID=UPI003813FB53
MPRSEVSPALADDEVNALFAAARPGRRATSFGPVHARSLLWVAARRDDVLIGYVDVAGGGGLHAFLLNPTVRPDERCRPARPSSRTDGGGRGARAGRGGRRWTTRPGSRRSARAAASGRRRPG